MNNDVAVLLAKRLIEQSKMIADGFTVTAQHINEIHELFDLYTEVILTLHKRIEQLEAL